MTDKRLLEVDYQTAPVTSGFGLIFDSASGLWLPAEGRTTKFGNASHYTQFNTYGHQTMVGDATAWRDELSDAISLQQTGPGVSRNSTESTVDYTAAANLNDFMFLNLQLNHDKDFASSIYPHIHWFQAANAVPNFLIEYRWQVDGGAKTTAWTPAACNTAVSAYGAGTIHQICRKSPSAISVPAGSFLSDIVQFKIYRDTANASGLFAGADPYVGTVGVLAFDIHFRINSLGSDQEYVK